MRTHPTSLVKPSSSCSKRMRSSNAGQANTPTITRTIITRIKPRGRLLPRAHSNHETPSNTIRSAQEYGLPELCWTGFQDRKSTRLNSSHVAISYAVFCLKKKKKNNIEQSIHTD